MTIADRPEILGQGNPAEQVPVALTPEQQRQVANFAVYPVLFKRQNGLMSDGQAPPAIFHLDAASPTGDLQYQEVMTVMSERAGFDVDAHMKASAEARQARGTVHVKVLPWMKHVLKADEPDRPIAVPGDKSEAILAETPDRQLWLHAVTFAHGTAKRDGTREERPVRFIYYSIRSTA